MTKALNIEALAKSLKDNYKEISMIVGGEEYPVRVYHVPPAWIWKYKPDRPEPIEPTITMKTAAGPNQARGIKPGDKGYDEWLLDSQSYEDEKEELQTAARYVLSLRDIEYPDLSSPPDLVSKVNGSNYPDNEILRKQLWLDCTLFVSVTNLNKIMFAIGELQTGVDSGLVEDIKKNSVLDSDSEK